MKTRAIALLIGGGLLLLSAFLGSVFNLTDIYKVAGSSACSQPTVNQTCIQMGDRVLNTFRQRKIAWTVTGTSGLVIIGYGGYIYAKAGRAVQPPKRSATLY